VIPLSEEEEHSLTCPNCGWIDGILDDGEGHYICPNCGWEWSRVERECED